MWGSVKRPTFLFLEDSLEESLENPKIIPLENCEKARFWTVLQSSLPSILRFLNPIYPAFKIHQSNLPSILAANWGISVVPARSISSSFASFSVYVE